VVAADHVEELMRREMSLAAVGDMATGKSAQIDKERRLLYVAMTRAKEHLYLIQPLRFFRTQQHQWPHQIS